MKPITWSPLSEHLYQEYLSFEHNTEFCPKRIREFFAGVPTSEGVELGELILCSAMNASMNASNREAVFDDVVARWLPQMFRYNVECVLKRKRGRMLWDCTEASLQSWQERFNFDKYKAFEVDVELQDVTTRDLTDLMRRHLHRPVELKLPSGKPYEVITQITPAGLDERGLFAKERCCVNKKSLIKALSARLYTKVEHEGFRHSAVLDVSKRLVAFVGSDIRLPNERASWLEVTLNQAVTAFTSADVLQFALKDFLEVVLQRLSALWELTVVGIDASGARVVWPMVTEPLLTWMESHNIKSLELFEVEAEQYKALPSRSRSLALASHSMSRRELIVVGIPIAGMERVVNIYEDPLCPLQ